MKTARTVGTRQVIGFIGLGKMGLGMASSLLKKGFNLIGYDINSKACKEIQTLGGEIAKTLKELASKSDVIILCLPHPNVSRKVIFGKSGLTKGKIIGKTIIETSSLDPKTTIEFAKKLAGLNISYLCTPILSGSVNDAKNGTLGFLAEGNLEVLKKNKKILLAMGTTVEYLGKPPLASATKMVRNIFRNSMLATGIEGLTLLRRYTNDIALPYEILVRESKDNFGQVLPRALREYALNGRPPTITNITLKDLEIATKEAKRQKVELKIIEAASNAIRQIS